MWNHPFQNPRSATAWHPSHLLSESNCTTFVSHLHSFQAYAVSRLARLHIATMHGPSGLLVVINMSDIKIKLQFDYLLRFTVPTANEVHAVSVMLWICSSIMPLYTTRMRKK